MVRDLHLAFLGAQQGLGHLGHSMAAGELAVQEVTGTWPLHDIRPGEASHLTETVIAVDDSAVLHTGIGYDELLICGGTNRVEKSVGVMGLLHVLDFQIFIISV